MTAGRRSFFNLAAFAAPCLPLAAFGLPLVITLPHYYSETLGISLAAVGGAFLLVRLLDIIFDPLFGMVLDRTTWSFGRFRSWMLISAPILMVSIYMLFFAREGVGAGYLTFWLLIAYFGYSIAVLSHTSWAAKLSEDYHQRSRIYAFWQTGNVIGMILILTLPALLDQMGLAKNETDVVQAQGWFIVLLLPVLIALAAWRVGDPRPTAAATDHNAGLGDYFRLIARPSVLRILAADLFTNLAPGIAGILFFFYFTRVKDFTFLEASTLLLFYFGAAIAGGVIWAALAKKVGKAKALMAACVTYAIVQFGVVTLPAGNFWLAVPFLIAAGIPFSAGPLLLRSMLADYADEERLATGKDRTGLLYAILTGTVKVGTATASVSLILLEGLGFNAQDAAASSELSMQGLQAMYAFAPGIIGLLGAAALIGYPLTEQKHAEILRQLGERDAASPPPVPEDVAVAQPVSTSPIVS
jgi:GPH family glycoside/pentoside/hexuronide:cation symporter